MSDIPGIYAWVVAHFKGYPFALTTFAQNADAARDRILRCKTHTTHTKIAMCRSMWNRPVLAMSFDEWERRNPDKGPHFRVTIGGK